MDRTGSWFRVGFERLRAQHRGGASHDLPHAGVADCALLVVVLLPLLAFVFALVCGVL